jgi:hypothetical protein
LKRFGPLPHEKALDVAHQLCAGVAAAHERGVLHLDLKPANVMIDARGRAIITDFGVARSAEEQATITIAGTPAYMAPEQLVGGPLTVQTDLYALGLIIRDLFTGFTAGSSESGEDPHDGVLVPASPAAIDPQVEAALRNCLEREMKDRPRSALAVATALPRGEALAAALAAGRTPSPEMVAAARREALRPAVAALLAATLVAGVLLVGLLNRSRLPNLAPTLSPRVLAARAHDIIQSLGYPHPPEDSAYWFTRKNSYLAQVLDRNAPFSANEGDSHRPLRFVYRESPAQLVPANIFGLVLYRDPPAEVGGMLDINLDTHGRLVRFCAIPVRRESTAASSVPTPDWGPLVRHAGLRPDALSPVAPIGIPPVPYDVLVEWKVLENASDRRVTAAAFAGSPVYFDVDSASETPASPSGDPPTMSRLTTDPTVLFASAAVALVCAVLIARHHALRGQADKRGASRLALYFFIINVMTTVLLPDHLTHFGEEYFLLAKLLAWGLYWCASAAVLYLAFEPFVRRKWPAMLIGWNRIMTGLVRDPVVGRDVIVGSVAGTSMVCIMWLVYAEGSWLNLHAIPPLRPALESFRDPRHFAVHVMFLHTGTLAFGLAGLFALAGFDRLLRAKWLGRAAWLILFLAVAWPGLVWGSDWRLALQIGIAQAMIAGPVLWRFGPVAFAAMLFTRDMLTRTPAALDFSAWYSNRALLSLAIVLAIGLYAARVAAGFTARRPAVADR